MRRLIGVVALVVIGAGCSADPSPAADDETFGDGSNADDVGSDDAGADSGSAAESVITSRCDYSNPFSGGPECREYEGTWTQEQVASDCEAQQGTLVEGTCDTGEIGRCVTPVEGAGDAIVHAYGDASGCQITGVACERFAGGTWEPEPVCEGSGGGGPSSDSVFIPPEQICTAPVDGEPEGQGPNGDVCTWQLISGATEEGRKFVDYASCDVVRTQRPYYAYDRPDDAEKDDPRMEDETYVAELSWVKSQIEATACVCCHQSSITPDGVSNWDIDQPGNFMNGFYDKGLALGANWINSVALGAFPAEENNGFDREISGFPSTDPERMKAFFVAELEHRGLSEADFDDTPPFGGPLYDQIYFEPSACPDGVGIDANGSLTWEDGPARYVYLLEVGSLSPTVPPNLDTPEGTIWRLDVAPDADPIESGSLRVGDVPEGATQKVPASGAPELESGGSYYLYVAADVGVPLTRCVTQTE